MLFVYMKDRHCEKILLEMHICLESSNLNSIILTLTHSVCMSIGKFQQKKEAFGAAKQRSSE